MKSVFPYLILLLVLPSCRTSKLDSQLHIYASGSGGCRSMLTPVYSKNTANIQLSLPLGISGSGKDIDVPGYKDNRCASVAKWLKNGKCCHSP